MPIHTSRPFSNVHSHVSTLDIFVSDPLAFSCQYAGNMDLIYFWFTPKYYANPSISQT